ncbi:MAG: cisplatin damage response ATP-dependent DNA ligase [Candidatus Sphingomonas colombiensis]|nr:cisplatin damage response ATP-dependent DNA ligase [Sphingomonas sp.]WEK44922.1 MAG: cisplatin damage response ATP-dependent DNA ligase [Sphingomonas sp.]
MEEFAVLLDALTYTRSRNGKVALIADYLLRTPDPDRGWALAALTSALDFPAVKSGTVRQLIAERVDPVLFALSRDYVGDTAETVSLLWPEPQGHTQPPSIREAVELLRGMTRNTAHRDLAALLDRLDAKGRYALLKFANGTMRNGVSARLAKVAFAQAFGVDVTEVEEYWHGQRPPYTALFDWATGSGPSPITAGAALFRPFMLANPLGETSVDLDQYAVEWKWDGIRVQIVHSDETRIYSRSGDDISRSFPELLGVLDAPVVLDGELLVRGSFQGGEQGAAASFNALQQRLNRKTVSRKMLEQFSAFVRLFDVLLMEEEDLRGLPWEVRRGRLERFAAELDPARFDVSAIVPVSSMAALVAVRNGARDQAIEGVMLKRRNSPYVAGRPTGLWYKWKRNPLLVDCVLMYAQRGNGRRSSYYSDYTFGCWNGDPDAGAELLPVGKSYFGFTEDELKWLDHHVRTHTINRFGPVRETDRTLVLEIAFDSIHGSRRHKSGLAMRFPRINRIRADKPAREADRIEMLRGLIAPE